MTAEVAQMLNQAVQQSPLPLNNKDLPLKYFYWLKYHVISLQAFTFLMKARQA